jgi:CDP-glycerol glycerophosphotransferase (TagB/SpsB family)
MINKIVEFLSLFFRTNPKNIVYVSFPDFSDNSFAMFCYIINTHKDYKNIWLVDCIEQKEKFEKLIKNYSNFKNYKIVKKNSLKGLLYFFTSKYVFHTHGIYNKLPILSKQKNINLWHGMPLKNIGHLDNNLIVPKSNFTIATSVKFKKIMQKAFKLEENQVIVSGLPRNDFLFTDKFSLLDVIPSKKATFNNTILWMPTYRKSTIGDIRVDGAAEEMNEFLNEQFLNELNDFLAKIKSLCVIKLHPMDVLKPNKFKEYSHLSIIDNSNFIERGISLYSVLNSADLLLTDFSSIYIDFLLLNKPIGFVISDYQDYFNSRGFVFEKPKEFMPGKLIENDKELLSFLEDLFINKLDNFLKERETVKNIFHDEYKTFSEKTLNTILN